MSLTFQGPPKSPPSVRTWSGDFALLQMLQDSQKSATSASGMTFQVGTGAYSATFRIRLADATANPFTLPELKSFSCPGKL